MRKVAVPATGRQEKGSRTPVERGQHPTAKAVGQTPSTTISRGEPRLTHSTQQLKEGRTTGYLRTIKRKEATPRYPSKESQSDLTAASKGGRTK